MTPVGAAEFGEFGTPRFEAGDATNFEAQDGVGAPDALQRLWTPHRMAYIKGESKPEQGAAPGQCPFCRI
ncbi:MAG: hypothetical protein ACRDTF_10800, partial [Pseudonocardiaceae bacterium]